ncbi:pyridoxal phosphate-dependent decarboxylase family protein [Amorphus coralli]|uniref:pyridoxal phosphate-dependent decarboxylase family protein n=1 Tax=Amorphus coralli TaxID=340680 RepID=UPI000370A734|nr:aminotransferase class V-fold PLP-dependent enzyme [Amorphus coralli]
MTADGKVSGIRARMADEVGDARLFDLAVSRARSHVAAGADKPPFPSPHAIAALTGFREPLPETPGDGAAIVDRLDRIGGPAAVNHLGGRYFGFVVGGVVPAAQAARQLADAWDQNAALHVLSPVTAALEEVTEGWLRALFRLPSETVAGFVSGSSMAIFCALAAARHRLLARQGWDDNEDGLAGSPGIRIVTSRQIHGTILKGLALLGLGKRSIEWVDCDDQGRILADRVPELDERTLLILQAGNVNSGSFDDFATLCARAREAGAWVHVDGAFGLWVAASDRLGHLLDGAELATSWSADAHKTLNAPYESGIVLCRDREALAGAMQASGSYILYSERRDGMLYTPEMSRRARAVDVWAALKYLGRSGLGELVDGFHALTCRMRDRLANAGFTILNDVAFNQLLVACADDAETEAVLTRIQASGVCWVGGARFRERAVIRFSVCSWATTPDDIDASAAAFVEALTAVRGRVAAE